MKAIDVYIERKEDLVEPYNKELVSASLLNYIINKVIYVTDEEELELKLHVTEETKGCSSMIKRGFEEEYQKNIKRRNVINLKQMGLLLIGIIILLISTLISDSNILHEVIIIAGWVPIWEAIELELLTDTKEKRKRKLLIKLINTSIEEILI